MSRLAGLFSKAPDTQGLLFVQIRCYDPLVRIEPQNIEQVGNELAIAWNDGSETFLPVRFLRTACPCAACGGEPDVMGDIVRPEVSYTDQSFELRSWNLVGGYAIQPTWGDGHHSGIYSYQYLRRIDPARASDK